jgi:hypothetical protein
VPERLKRWNLNARFEKRRNFAIDITAPIWQRWSLNHEHHLAETPSIRNQRAGGGSRLRRA